MTHAGTEHLPLFGDPAPSARTLGQEAVARAAKAHPAEFKRCVGIAQELAKKDTGNRGITIEMVRRAAGLLTSTGRDLAFLGAVMKAAGLQPTGQFRRSELPGSHGNLQQTWTGAHGG